MTEKNIFVYKLSLSLNVSDFSLFLWKNLITTLWKLRSCQAPSFLKIWQRFNSRPPAERGWGAHYGFPVSSLLENPQNFAKFSPNFFQKLFWILLRTSSAWIRACNKTIEYVYSLIQRRLRNPAKHLRWSVLRK